MAQASFSCTTRRWARCGMSSRRRFEVAHLRQVLKLSSRYGNPLPWLNSSPNVILALRAGHVLP